MVSPRRGEVWWASLKAPQGSDPGYRRPVLVVQSNSFNASSIHTVLVVAITSNLALAEAPGNVRLPKAAGGLPRSSVVNVSQLLSVDRSFFNGRLGTLSSRQMNAVAEGLRLVLAL